MTAYLIMMIRPTLPSIVIFTIPVIIILLLLIVIIIMIIIIISE